MRYKNRSFLYYKPKTACKFCTNRGQIGYMAKKTAPSCCPGRLYSLFIYIGYASIFAWSAFFSMNSRRGPTSSPISIENT